LEYIFKANNGEGASRKRANEKANRVVEEMCGVNDRMFESLVKNVTMSGVEIWGWTEQEKLEEG
jgi:hypothetical protein